MLSETRAERSLHARVVPENSEQALQLVQHKLQLDVTETLLLLDSVQVQGSESIGN